MCKFSSDTLNIIAVYISSGADKNDLLAEFDKLITQGKPCIILGDFNICSLKEQSNAIIGKLHHNGFNQVVRKATYDSGSCLDHCYTTLGVTLSHHALYWSGNDVLPVTVPPKNIE